MNGRLVGPCGQGNVVIVELRLINLQVGCFVCDVRLFKGRVSVRGWEVYQQ